MAQKVVSYSISAPKKSNHISPREFCEKTFIPEYKLRRDNTPASTKVKMEVVIDKSTEQTLYFVEVNKILRELRPELISCYTISRRK